MSSKLQSVGRGREEGKRKVKIGEGRWKDDINGHLRHRDEAGDRS